MGKQQTEEMTEQVVVDSGDEVSEGIITKQEASEPVTREVETQKQFEARDPLKPKPLAVRPEKPSTEILDGKISNTHVEETSEGRKEVVLVKSYKKCFIGGTWYEFKAGQRYRVSKTVKERLKAQGILEVA